MKNARWKKKQQQPNKKLNDPKQHQHPKRTVLESKEESTKRTVLESLVEAFSLSSMEEASIAYDEAGGDPGKASEMLLKGLAEKNAEDRSSCSSTSYSSSSCSGVSGSDVGSSSSGSSEGFLEGFGGRNQKKKVVAATGTVSTILGKGYVRRNCDRNKGFGSVVGGDRIIVEKEEAKQFLCFMLGKDSDLNWAVVRDVLCGFSPSPSPTISINLTLPHSPSLKLTDFPHLHTHSSPSRSPIL